MAITYFALPIHLARMLTGVGLMLALSQCGIREQVQQAKAFKDTEIRLASVEQATVAGINVTQLRQPDDLSIADRTRLVAAYATGNLPLHMRVNLEVRNPNSETAALNELEYIALLDGKQIAVGHTTERVEVPPNGGVAIAPVTLDSNLRQVLGKQSADNLVNFVLGLADHDRQPMRLTLRLKPTFLTSSGRRISPGGYTNIEKEFTARQALRAIRADSAVQQP